MATDGKVADGDETEDRTRGSLTPEAAVEAVGNLIAMMEAGNVKELDLSFADVSIRLRSQGKGAPKSPKAPIVDTSPPPAPQADDGTVATINAPMVGTFYVAASPQDPPFVNLGDYIEVGQVIGIIEAMKIMNEIVADRSGRVVAIVAQNGEAVEYGSPLLRVAQEANAAP